MGGPETPEKPRAGVPCEDSGSPRGDHGHSQSVYLKFNLAVRKILNLLLPFLFVTALILILLWDMRRSSIISEIIHDDHTNLWVKMNATALSQWFTALDLCMLDINKPEIDVKTFRQKNCSRHASGNGVSSHRLFCGIGSSLGRQCAAPLSTRYFFQYRLAEELGNPSSGSLKSALKRIAESKRALVFIGDALSKQNQEALVCEAMRTDKIWITGEVYGGNSHTAATSFTMRWKDRPTLSLDVIFIHVAHINDEAKDAKLANTALGSFVNDETAARRHLRSHNDTGDNTPLRSRHRRRRKLSVRQQLVGGDTGSDSDNDKQQTQQSPAKHNTNTNKYSNHSNSSRASTADAYMHSNDRIVRNHSDGAYSVEEPWEQVQDDNKKERRKRSLSSTAHSDSNNNNNKNQHDNADTTSSSSSTSSSSNTSLYEHNSPSMTLNAVKDEIDKLKSRYSNGLVLIANVGVWYNSREQFRKDLPTFMHWLDGIGRANQNLVFFRETAAQHWNHTVHGYYSKEDGANDASRQTCAAIADSTADLDWRNRDVYHTIKNDNIRNIKVIPFRDITAPLHDMHPEATDCTRYCYFPQMWQTVWMELYKATRNSSSAGGSSITQPRH